MTMIYRPAENDADYNGWDAQRVHDPSKLYCVTLKELFAHREMDDQDDLNGKRPNGKQCISLI